jgi:predicted RNase H-like HicB family nuclease
MSAGPKSTVRSAGTERCRILGPDGKAYVAVLTPETEPGFEGIINATVPQLPGCVSYGQGRDEALANLREALAAYLETLGESAR